MAAQSYLTRSGDVLDAIVHAHYGATSGLVEQVLEANPGLAAQGPVLPAGITILLPDLGTAPGQPPIESTVRLWD